MPVVRLGNPKALNHATGKAVKGERITEAHLDPGKSLADQLRDITHDDGGPHTGLWASHSEADAPSWVVSDSPELEAALAAHYGCPVGQPDTDDEKG
jgi:hypothetical protein